MSDTWINPNIVSNMSAKIYRDGWIPSRPWQADLYENGKRVAAPLWHSYKTKKSLVENIVAGGIPEDRITRGEDQ